MGDDAAADSEEPPPNGVSSQTAASIEIAVRPTGPDAAPPNSVLSDSNSNSTAAIPPPLTIAAATPAAATTALDLSLLEPTHKRAIMYCAACFFMLFSSWSPTQSYIGAVHADFGPYAFIMIYLCLAVFGLLAPSIIIRFGVRRSFILSAAAYIVFSLALSLESESSVPVATGIASCLVGASAAVLWVSQGMFVKSVSVQAGGYAGYLTGLWFSIYSFAPLVGNAMAGGLISVGLSVPQVLLVCSAIAAVATVMFVFVRETPIDPSTVAPIREKVLQIITIWKDRAMQTLMLLMACLGIAKSFQLAVFPILVNDLGRGSQHVGFIMVVYGVMAIAASYAAGRVLDRWGWKIVAATYLVDVLTGYCLCAVGMSLASTDDTASALAIYYICGFCFGVSDALITVLINASIVLWFEKNSGPAFASNRVVSSSTWIIGVLIRLASSASGVLIATVLISCVSIGYFAYYQLRTLPALRALKQLAAQAEAPNGNAPPAAT